MKKLMFAALAVAAFTTFAEETKNETEGQEVVQEQKAPLFWGFANTGIYSGYQLYGSLVNSEPTWQTYIEGNLNLSIGDVSLGYLGIGIWNNCDLTDKRRDSYGKWFNEQDYNVHWGYTLWFDDDNTWGLAYRTSVVWYYYPHNRHQDFIVNGGRNKTDTTMDWNHYFELVNPYVIPYINVVHEYHESDANLLQFGLKKTIAVNDSLSLTPSIEFVWRNSHYCWCFPKFGTKAEDPNYEERVGSGLATMKIGVDANYQITPWMGVFAKVAYCSIIDDDLRNSADAAAHADYGQYKDFAWGGVGLSFNF